MSETLCGECCSLSLTLFLHFSTQQRQLSTLGPESVRIVVVAAVVVVVVGCQRIERTKWYESYRRRGRLGHGTKPSVVVVVVVVVVVIVGRKIQLCWLSE